MIVAKNPTMSDDDERRGQILFFEALRDSIKDGELDSAIESIDAAIKLLRREKRDGND